MSQQNLDLFYPQVLDVKGRLQPNRVNDALRQAFNLLYRIAPPPGSQQPSSLSGLTGLNVDDVPADRLSTGTVRPGVEITLSGATIATPVPAKLKWGTSGQVYTNQVSNLLFVVPQADKSSFLLLGSDTTGNVFRWKGITLSAHFTSNCIISIRTADDVGGDAGYYIASGTGATNHLWQVDGLDTMTLDDVGLAPATTGAFELGSSSLKWKNLYLTNPLKVVYGGTELVTTPTDGQLLIGKTSTNKYVLATLTGTSSQVIVTNGSGTITLSLPQDIGTGSTPTFGNLIINSQALIQDIVTNSGQDLFLDPQGGGVVKFGTYTALPGVVTGFITVKDASGASRNLAVI